MIGLNPTESKVYKAGLEVQASLPRSQGVLLRQLTEKTGFCGGWVWKQVTILESKGLVRCRRENVRRNKGSIRFLRPRKSA